MAAAAILFSMDSSQKLIRSSKIPREQRDVPNLNAIPPTVQKLWCPQAFYSAIFFQMAAATILFLMDSS